MINLIKELTNAYGPSGQEEVIRSLIQKRIASKVDEMYTDTLGNLIAVKKGPGKRIMLAAHMDEIGLIATFVDEKGFIRFSNSGGVSPFIAAGQRVIFRNGTIGMVCYEENLEDMKDLKMNRMYIDIGTKNREETERLVNPGDMSVFVGEALEQNNRYISKALDDRIGCAILIALIERMGSTENEIVFVFTVQEEVGLRGAGPAAYGIKPDLAIAVDVTNTGDTPDCKPLAIDLGKGPAIMVKDNRTISHPLVKDALVECAQQENIPYQMEVLNVGGNDAGAIHITAGGIPSGGVSIPCRYLHRPCEMVDKNDVENTIRLLEAFIKRP
ncbi:MAG: M42 family metallopeptidase [Clostridiaceae bacterium]|jgi:endoglucanase|nr:M42 family metallopeptidase [Clostridiaceae bacterium]